MTAKEAFEAQEILKEFRKGLDSLSESKLIGALDMAIEALNHSEIPNSSDCIDRAEAQTAIQFAARRYTVAHEAHGEGHVVWSDNLISVTDAMNALKEVPSAQPEREKGKWTKDCACEICGFKPWYERDIHTLSFCPNCGADMR